MTRKEQLISISEYINALRSFQVNFGFSETDKGCTIYQHIGERTTIRACNLTLQGAIEWLDGYVWACHDFALT